MKSLSFRDNVKVRSSHASRVETEDEDAESLGSSLRSSCTEDTFVMLSEINILDLADRMRTELKPKTEDRRWHLRVYKNCFLYSDALWWLMRYVRVTHVDERVQDQHELSESRTVTGQEREKAAVKLGNLLIDAGYISHVTNSHRFVEGRSWELLFFRFNDRKLDMDIAERRLRSRMEAAESRKQSTTASALPAESSAKGYTTETQLLDHETTERLMRKVNMLEMNNIHLSAALISTSQLIGEANDRVAMLETHLLVAFYVLLAFLYSWYVGGGIKIGVTFVNALLFAAFTAVLYVHMSNSLRRTNVARLHVPVLRKILESGDDEETVSIGEEASATSFVPAGRLTMSAVEISQHVMRICKGAAIRSPISVPQRKDNQRRLLGRADLPTPSEWPHRPVFVCPSSYVSPTVVANEDRACPIGVPFEFESDYFVGKALFRFQNVPSDDPKGNAAYFDGRQRRFQSIVQGKFKEEFNVADVLTGHEFSEPFKSLPPKWVVSAGSSLISKIAPGITMDLHSDEPKFLSILAATSQAVSADMPGNEPLITNGVIGEDLSILGGDFENGSTSVTKRKRLLSDPNIASRYKFDNETIYTFDFYQHLLDVSTYSVNLGFATLDISRSLNGQPIQVMAKTVSGKYLWSFQIWHEKLLS